MFRKESKMRKCSALVWIIKMTYSSTKSKWKYVKPNNQSSPREYPRQVARIYDPIGLAAPYLVRAKIGLQELWQKDLTGMMNYRQVIK